MRTQCRRGLYTHLLYMYTIEVASARMYLCHTHACVCVAPYCTRVAMLTARVLSAVRRCYARCWSHTDERFMELSVHLY